MKKISLALIALLGFAGAASAQTDSGIVMTHDANVAAQIEQHAQTISMQSGSADVHAPAADQSAHKKGHHHGHKKSSTKSTASN